MFMLLTLCFLVLCHYLWEYFNHKCPLQILQHTFLYTSTKQKPHYELSQTKHPQINPPLCQRYCFLIISIKPVWMGKKVKGMDLKVSVKSISHDVCLIPAQVFSQGFWSSVLCKSRRLTFHIPHARSSPSSTAADNTGQIS